MIQQDEITITILKDGSVRVENDKISPANHRRADDLHKDLERDLGGSVSARKKVGNHTHHQHEKHKH